MWKETTVAYLRYHRIVKKELKKPVKCLIQDIRFPSRQVNRDPPAYGGVLTITLRQRAKLVGVLFSS
jgi:hypothetical protein